jgi:hypothetical protein
MVVCDSSHRTAIRPKSVTVHPLKLAASPFAIDSYAIEGYMEQGLS